MSLSLEFVKQHLTLVQDQLEESQHIITVALNSDIVSDEAKTILLSMDLLGQKELLDIAINRL